MHVEDLNTPTDAAADVTATTTDDIVAAIDAGLAAEAGTGDAASTDTAAATDAGADAEGEGADTASDTEAKPDAAATPADAATPDAEAKPDPVEAEVKELGLKEKAAERFREFAAERAQMAPLREAMKAVGLEDPAIAAQALARVRDADYVIGRVTETGADAEQFDKTLNYLALVNNPNDMAALEQAWNLILPEIEVLAKALGKEIPGVVDPLAGHDDLRAEVEAGDMSRERAIEVARLRQREAMLEQGRQAQRETGERQQQAQQAHDAGRQSLNELGAELQAADPARYAALGPALVEKVREITAQYPPQQWAERAARAYATLPMPKSTPAVPPVGHMPLRPTGSRAELDPATFDDPMAAMEFGLQQASR